MTDPAALAAALDSILNIDHQASELERAAVAVADLPDRDLTLVRACLGVFERCGAQDDFGMFHSLQCYLEQFADDDEVRAAVKASTTRAPSWKAIEILPGFAGIEGAIEVLEQVQRDGSFTDRRYKDSWLQDQIDELRAEL